MAYYLIARSGLGKLTKLGQGGQGVVYEAPKVKAKYADTMAFKEYKPHARRDVNFDALSAMTTLVTDDLPYHDGEALVSIAAWPCALVESDSGPVGFVMPAIPRSFFIDLTTVKGRSRTTSEFQHLLNPPSVLAARGVAITDEQRYQLLREVARALAFFHRIGVCVGDISPKNVLFSMNPRPAVYFIDCDTMRVNGVSALPQMETPEWQVPAGEELATTYSDTYKLGLLALRLLAGDQHTKNPQELPPTTPKSLRQLVTDTLTKEPDHRPLPEAWTYLLSHVSDEGGQNATDPLVTSPKPAAPTHVPEPPPVVRSRPTTTPPAGPPFAGKTPALSNPGPLDDLVLWLRASPVRILALGVIIFIAIISVISLIHSFSGGSSSSTATRQSSITSSIPTTISTTPPSPTSSAGLVERTIRNARVGDCFRRTMGPEDSDGRYDIIDLTPNGCGNAGSEIRVVGKQVFYTEDAPECNSYSDGRMWAGGETPRVLICYVYD